MNETVSPDANLEQAAQMPDRFSSLDDAVKALENQERDQADEAYYDATDEDQPEEAREAELENDGADEEVQADGAEESEDGEEQDGDDTFEDIGPIEYDPSLRLTLEDGTESTFEDLVKGNLRQADYTRKTEALAEDRREVESIKESIRSQSEELNRTYAGLVEFLQGIMPPEPPLELLGQDQGEYLRQQAIRKSFTDELSAVLNNQAMASSQIDAFGQAEAQTLRAAETKKLIEAMPMLGDDMKMASFKEGVQNTAMSFGFSEQEISAVFDHRLLHLVHMAGIGKRSLENGKNARRRIERKTATPAMTKPASKAAKRTVSNNGKAMRRLSQSGSIEDAMMVDF